MPFGIKQLSNPTPHKVGLLCDFLAAIFGIIAAYLTSASFVSHSVSDVLSSILTGLMIPIILVVKRFFGVEIDTKRIDTDQVTEVETKKD